VRRETRGVKGEPSPARKIKKLFKIRYLNIAFGWMICFGACAQAFPTKPVRLVIGPAPELLPRLVGQKLSELWGQQVVVDQRPGAGGIVAGDLVSRAAPDGYTWLMSTGAFYVIDAMYPKLSYNMVRDFAPVTLMATIPFICVVHPGVPAKSLADLVQLAKSQPGKLNFASGGTGTTTQLAAELFRLSAKIDIIHVPYKGVAPAVTEVLAGQVQMMFSIAQAVVPHVQSGKLRALAITSTKRARAVPEVPTMGEAGFPEIDIVGWNGVSVPIRTPRALVNKLNADIRRVLGQKELQERMIAAGFDLNDTTVEQFEAHVKKDVVLYNRIIRESRIKLD
jgi:tripartite-type tricarboxylate transporter receptor subunit TctC